MKFVFVLRRIVASGSAHAALLPRVDADELTVVLLRVLRAEVDVCAEPRDDLVRARERAEDVRAIDLPLVGLRRHHRVHEEAVLRREEDRRAGRGVERAAERGIEQRFVPHDRAAAGVAEVAHALHAELQVQLPVVVAQVE